MQANRVAVGGLPIGGFFDEHKPVGCAEGKRPQKQGIENAEDGRVYTQAKGEKHHAGDQKQRTAPQTAEGNLDIAKRALKAAEQIGVAGLFLLSQQVAVLRAGKTGGFLRPMPAVDQFLLAHLEMKLGFLLGAAANFFSRE